MYTQVPINMGLVGFGATAGQAWLGTLLITGTANYFVIGALMDGKKEKR